MKCNLLTGYHYGKECKCADCYWVGRGCCACSHDDYRFCYCCGENEDNINTDCEDHLPVKPVARGKTLPKWDDGFCECQIEETKEERDKKIRRPPPKRKTIKASVVLMLKNQSNKCWWCGKDISDGDYQKDHRIPRAKGGVDDDENIVLACTACNQKKRAKMPQEFAHRLF